MIRKRRAINFARTASPAETTGTFDQITTYAVFALWLFFGVTVSPVFVLRVAAWLVINTIKTNPVESGIGLALIALGLPIYFYFKRKRARMVAEDNAGIAQPATY